MKAVARRLAVAAAVCAASGAATAFVLGTLYLRAGVEHPFGVGRQPSAMTASDLFLLSACAAVYGAVWLAPLLVGLRSRLAAAAVYTVLPWGGVGLWAALATESQGRWLGPALTGLALVAFGAVHSALSVQVLRLLERRPASRP